MKRIAIIGGGAAGMMVGATILEQVSDSDFAQNFQITLFERNDTLGAKVVLSGGGRCNLTTGITDIDELVGKYPRGGEFLRSGFAQFGPAEIGQWFDNHGIPLKEEQNHRVFPVSNDGQDVVRVFTNIFAQDARIQIRYGAVVKSIDNNQQEENFLVKFAQKNSDIKEGVFDIVVLTTGGNAYAQTGSQGNGYKFAQSLGHAITPLAPSLSSLLVAENWVKDLSGISLPNVKLKVKNITVIPAQAGIQDTKKVCPKLIDSRLRGNDKQGKVGENYDENNKLVQCDGGFLFAHFGVTGPVVFALSAQIAFAQFDQNNPLKVKLIIDKNKNVKNWDLILCEEFARDGKLKLWQVLVKLIPKKLTPVVCDLFGSNPKVAEISKKARQQIAQILGDGLPMTVIGRRPGDEFVTAGGVDTAEINPKTCQSKLVPNLYFAGEILNIDGVTGGFNLTACWTTGYTVGTDIAQKHQA